MPAGRFIRMRDPDALDEIRSVLELYKGGAISLDHAIEDLELILEAAGRPCRPIVAGDACGEAAD